MKLNTLSPADGSGKNRKRIGRGIGSGHGKTSGHGHKGQKARSGGGVRPGYEGGQMPIHRRLPKRGFNNVFKKNYALINIDDLTVFQKDSIIDEAALIDSGLVKGRYDGVKLLGRGEIQQPLTIQVNKASQSALQKITAAGGKVEEI